MSPLYTPLWASVLSLKYIEEVINWALCPFKDLVKLLDSLSSTLFLIHGKLAPPPSVLFLAITDRITLSASLDRNLDVSLYPTSLSLSPISVQVSGLVSSSF